MWLRDKFYRGVWVSAVMGSLMMLATGLFLGTIAIDDELNIFRNAFDTTGRGMWGAHFVTWLLPGQLGISFVPMFLGILLYATSTTILIHFWGVRDQVVARLSACIIGVFPYFASMMTFDVVQVAYPLGFVCIVLSLYPVFIRFDLRHFCIGVALFAFAFSLYQGVASIILTAFVSIVGMQFVLADNKEKKLSEIILRYSPRFVLLGILGSATYLVTSKVIQASIDHSKWSGGYQVAFDFTWSMDRLLYIVRQVLGLLTGWEYDLPGLSVALFFLMIAALSGAIFRVKDLAMWKKGAMFIAVWAALCLSPFWLAFAQSNALAPRSTVGLGIVYAFLFSSLATLTAGPGRKLVVGVAAIWCLQFVFLGNEMYYTQHLAYQADRDTANRIVNRIDSLAGSTQLPYPTPVTFVGKYEHPTFGQKKFSVLGASVFEWDQGNIYRQVAFLNLMYVSGFQSVIEKEITEKVDAYILENEVPGWPQPGSVFVFDDELVVVNLGPRAYSDVNFKKPVQKILQWVF